MASHEKILTKNLEVWSSSTKAKATSGRAGNKKLELYGLKKLRELILQLAVSGKLIPRESKWNGAKFEEIFDFQGGGQPPKSQFISEPRDGYIRLFQIRDLGENPMPTYIPKEGVRNFCDENDILIGRYGASVGKIFKGKEGTYNVALVKLIWSAESFDQEFLMTWLKGKAFQNRLTDISRSAQAGFNKRDLASIHIQYPNLPEQKRIIEKVKKLMTLCDKLDLEQEIHLKTHEAMLSTLLKGLTSNLADACQFEEYWKLIQDNFDVLFTTERSIEHLEQTILKLAVMGKLIQQESGDEPAEVLFKKITEKKGKLIEKGLLKKQKQLPHLEKEKPYQIPENWKWVRLNDAFDIRDGTHDSPQDAIGDNTYPLVTTKDFKNGKIDFTGAKRISSEDHFKICERSNVEVNDILFSMIGSIGNQVIVEDPRPFSIKNVALFKYYSQEFTVPKFLKIYTEELAFGLKQKASGAVQPFISLGFLRNLPFALPPTAEQHRIVAKVDELMTLCEKLKASIASKEAKQLNLADSLIDKVLR